MSKVKQVEVLIIGAGPAGSVCGYLLQKAGVDCLLVDRATFPRDKICGGGLTPKAWQLLEELMPGIKYDYLRIDHIRLLIDEQYRCDFHIDDECRMLRIVRRRDFDHLLLQRYLQAGGKFLQGTFADFEENSGDYPVVVTLRSGEQIACRYLVGADGATSQVRHRIDPSSSNGILSLEQYQDRSSSTSPFITVALSNKYDHGYFYVFPNQSHDVVGLCDKRTTKDRFREVTGELGYSLQTGSQLRGAYIPRSSVVSPSPRVMLIGDAGGFANRVSYEGLYYAIATAKNACESIVSKKDFRQVNKAIFRKKRKEDVIDHLAYSRCGLAVLKLVVRSPRFVKACYNFFV